VQGYLALPRQICYNNPPDMTISFRNSMAFTTAGGVEWQPLMGSVAAMPGDIGRSADCVVRHLVMAMITPDVAEKRWGMEHCLQDVRPGIRA
jgi:hypothetical protein